MMKTIIKVTLLLALIVTMIFETFATKKYYAKFMPQDYSNWVWQEIPNVTSCVKSANGLQYVIKYRGIAEPRVVYNQSNHATNELMKERDLTMTIGVDNIIIYEYDD